MEIDTDNFLMILSPIFLMALDAKCLRIGKIHEMFVFSAMGAMTAHALQGDVLISGIKDLFPDRMG